MATSSLSAAQISRVRRLSAPTEPAPGEEAGELNIVPYLDILMNILMFVLATIAVTFVASTDVTPPRLNPILHGGAGHALGLTVLLTDAGFSMKTSGGNVAMGCGAIGDGVTVPLQGGTFDLAGLSECARKIKASAPELASEDQVTLTASPGIAYEHVIAAMDALRRDDQGELFPRVAFGVVR